MRDEVEVRAGVDLVSGLILRTCTCVVDQSVHAKKYKCKNAAVFERMQVFISRFPVLFRNGFNFRIKRVPCLSLIHI